MNSLLVYDAYANEGSPAVVNVRMLGKLENKPYLLIAYGSDKKELGRDEATPQAIVSRTFELAERHSPVTIEVLLEGVK